MKSNHIIRYALAAATLSLSALQADEVTDAINEALSSYQSGDLTNAAAQLDYASTLVRQNKAQSLVALFCEPLEGWTSDEADSNAAAGAFLGGGISASKRYSKGESEVTINLFVDSPMLQSVSMMLANPAMLGMTGGKLVKVQGYKAILQSESDEHELSFVVNNALLTMKGSYGTTKDELMAYASALNLSVLQ